MAGDFLHIYFTSPGLPPDQQAQRITAALEWGGFDIAHVRLPDASEAEVETTVQAVPLHLRRRLTLHDHFGLAPRLGVGGLHLNSRNPNLPQGWNGRVSRSCHTPGEAELWSERCDYVTLSPIFPSISKPGYAADFGNLRLSRPNIVALGGITVNELPRVRAMGFGGAAVMGWLDTEPNVFYRRLRRFNMMRDNRFALQYITNGKSVDEVVQEVADVLAGGCSWVQVRMKDTPVAEIAETARRVAEMCHEIGAICLIDDHVDLVKATGADGVHLGKNDMPARDARMILGESKIIGSTANTEADINDIQAGNASDYIGLGPYRFTTTKQRLSPVLGLEGYRRIFEQRDWVRLPVVAIGGIELPDIAPIMQAGASGIAISGAIGRAPDRTEATKAILIQLSHAKVDG